MLLDRRMDKVKLVNGITVIKYNNRQWPIVACLVLDTKTRLNTRNENSETRSSQAEPRETVESVYIQCVLLVF